MEKEKTDKSLSDIETAVMTEIYKWMKCHNFPCSETLSQDDDMQVSSLDLIYLLADIFNKEFGNND